MNEATDTLRYTKTHEWVRQQEDGTLCVGISEHAQELLGDIVFIELPQLGDTFEAKSECMVIESVKAAADIYCPVAGEITAINSRLEDSPELVNQSPQEDGWLFCIKADNDEAINDLYSAEEYRAQLAAATT